VVLIARDSDREKAISELNHREFRAVLRSPEKRRNVVTDQILRSLEFRRPERLGTAGLVISERCAIDYSERCLQAGTLGRVSSGPLLYRCKAFRKRKLQFIFSNSRTIRTRRAQR
jgi:hypothetical protein